MKILMISGTFPPRKFGGITAVSYTLAKKIAEQGHEVTVYTTDVGNNRSSRLNVQGAKIINGINVHYFKNISNSLAFKHRLFLPIRMISAIRKDITNFDIIHIHGFRGIQEVIACYYAKKYNVPYVLQAHGSVLPIFQKQRLKKIFDLFFGYKILRDASKAIAVTETEAEQYKKMGVDEDRIEIVPNGIDLSESDNLPEKGEFRRKFDIGDKYMILYVGRINIRKGVDFLVKSFFELIKDMNNVTLVIAGPDDGYQNEIKKLIANLKLQNKIKFTGFVDERDKLSAYIDADLLVYPAIWEIFGLVPFEALMCGTPVIVTDDCGCGELVKEANCGYLVKYSDIKGLKEKMKRVIENPEKGKEMVERGKRCIEENLMWDKVVKKVENIYLSCLSSKS